MSLAKLYCQYKKAVKVTKGQMALDKKMNVIRSIIDMENAFLTNDTTLAHYALCCSTVE